MLGRLQKSFKTFYGFYIVFEYKVRNESKELVESFQNMYPNSNKASIQQSVLKAKKINMVVSDQGSIYSHLTKFSVTICYFCKKGRMIPNVILN